MIPVDNEMVVTMLPFPMLIPVDDNDDDNDNDSEGGVTGRTETASRNQ